LFTSNLLQSLQDGQPLDEVLYLSLRIPTDSN
jgi:hypothetical protein